RRETRQSLVKNVARHSRSPPLDTAFRNTARASRQTPVGAKTCFEGRESPALIHRGPTSPYNLKEDTNHADVQETRFSGYSRGAVGRATLVGARAELVAVAQHSIRSG